MANVYTLCVKRVSLQAKRLADGKQNREEHKDQQSIQSSTITDPDDHMGK